MNYDIIYDIEPEKEPEKNYDIIVQTYDIMVCIMIS